MPNFEPKVRFLTDMSESENTAEEGSLVDCPTLYGRNPLRSESGTEAGDETDINCTPTIRDMPSTSSGYVLGDNVPDLSGRCRAILENYFQESDAFNLPQGHPVVAFTEPQVYHLLRVLNDETLKKLFDTVERMVIEAVKGKTSTTPSRTSHFQTKRRAQTPERWIHSDSKQETSGHSGAASASGSEDLGDTSYDGETDSATEMALISNTFKPMSEINQEHPTTEEPNPEQATEHSSQDATLLELQQSARNAKTPRPSMEKRSKAVKRPSRRKAPMREEFFSKIRWTSSFISGPVDPIHNPHMVWCHMCKKNFSIRNRVPLRFCATIGPRNI